MKKHPRFLNSHSTFEKVEMFVSGFKIYPDENRPFAVFSKSF